MRGVNQTGVSEESARAAYALQAMARHEVIAAVEANPDCAWLKRAMAPSSGALVQLLGVFWMKGRTGLWPAVLLHVTFGGKRRTAAAFAATPPRSGWRTTTRLGEGVPWQAWAGKAEGEPGVVNGDDPRRSLSPASTVGT